MVKDQPSPYSSITKEQAEEFDRLLTKGKTEEAYQHLQNINPHTDPNRHPNALHAYLFARSIIKIAFHNAVLEENLTQMNTLTELIRKMAENEQTAQKTTIDIMLGRDAITPFTQTMHSCKIIAMHHMVRILENSISEIPESKRQNKEQDISERLCLIINDSMLSFRSALKYETGNAAITLQEFALSSLFKYSASRTIIALEYVLTLMKNLKVNLNIQPDKPMFEGKTMREFLEDMFLGILLTPTPQAVQQTLHEYLRPLFINANQHDSQDPDLFTIWTGKADEMIRISTLFQQAAEHTERYLAREYYYNHHDSGALPPCSTNSFAIIRQFGLGNDPNNNVNSNSHTAQAASSQPSQQQDNDPNDNDNDNCSNYDAPQTTSPQPRKWQDIVSSSSSSPGNQTQQEEGRTSP